MLLSSAIKRPIRNHLLTGHYCGAAILSAKSPALDAMQGKAQKYLRPLIFPALLSRSSNITYFCILFIVLPPAPQFPCTRWTSPPIFRLCMSLKPVDGHWEGHFV